MSAKSFVDTNILVYAHDRSAGRKHQLAKNLLEELWNSGEGILSTQVLQELCVSLRRKVTPPLAFDEVRSLLQDYLTWQVVINAADSVVHALDLEARYKISFWDALIVHAAEASGATTLYSEDLGDRQKFGALRVVNPFSAGDRQR
jgi:predicted nucleic acid-binding protein